ncbi:MAG: hypothetical protein LQ342_008098 [Letrouitia transgressa]|nr:MAG: hypothetical protein LQ342_008098 [Letrouitia transgressa]
MTVHRPLQDPTLHLPRILCLHGGGTNARIFRLQCRILLKHLESTFRLCFAEAPFPSQAGSDVIAVYKEYGPFRRWLRFLPEHPNIEASCVIEKIEGSLDAAKKQDDAKGATGEWVGMLGFSQGAKLCASIMLRQQIRTQTLGWQRRGTDYRFAILLAGRGPLVRLEPDLIDSPALADASELGSQTLLDGKALRKNDHVLQLPTIHVHGLRDPGLDLHRSMLEGYCDRENSKLFEWDGDHRVPIKTKDVAPLVSWILYTGRQTGVL